MDFGVWFLHAVGFEGEERAIGLTRERGRSSAVPATKIWSLKSSYQIPSIESLFLETRESIFIH